MDHFIEQIDIRNFKSIRKLTLTGFKRINLFIGRPNVGKSNLLEAIGLFSLPFLRLSTMNLADIVRVGSQREIYHEGNVDEKAMVKIERNKKSQEDELCELSFNSKYGFSLYKNYLITKENSDTDKEILSRVFHEIYRIEKNLVINGLVQLETDLIEDINIKLYFFRKNIILGDIQTHYLTPPFGNNLYNVIEFNNELRKTYAQWFELYNLRLVLDTASMSFKIQRDKGNGEVFQLPYSSVADTLQRIIFYKTAVASNENSVLLFEEPEAHAYPPYIAEFTWEVIKSKTNQTFIITHSPLIVEQFLSDALDDLAIFMVDFEDGQTVVKGLTTEEIKEVYRYGVDLFFNGESYTK